MNRVSAIMSVCPVFSELAGRVGNNPHISKLSLGV